MVHGMVELYPIGSMVLVYMLTLGGILMVNVTIYTIHGSYGSFCFQAQGM